MASEDHGGQVNDPLMPKGVERLDTGIKMLRIWSLLACAINKNARATAIEQEHGLALPRTRPFGLTTAVGPQ
jgi:hypothetical protein